MSTTPFQALSPTRKKSSPIYFLWFRFSEDIEKILFLQNSSALNWYLMCQSDVMDGRTYVLILTMSFGRFSRNLTSLLGPRLFSLYLTMCGFKILSLAVTKVPLAVLSLCQSWSYASLRAHKQFWTQFFLEKMASAGVGRKIILSSHLFRRLSAIPATEDAASLFRQQWPIHC